MTDLVSRFLVNPDAKVITAKNVDELGAKEVVRDVLKSILRKIPNSYIIAIKHTPWIFAIDGNPLSIGRLSASISINAKTYGAVEYSFESMHINNNKGYISTTLPRKAVTTAVKFFKPATALALSQHTFEYNRTQSQFFTEQRIEKANAVKEIAALGVNVDGFPLLEALSEDVKYQDVPVVRKYKEFMRISEKFSAELAENADRLTVVAPVFYSATGRYKYLLHNTNTRLSTTNMDKLEIASLADEHPALLSEDALPDYVQSAMAILNMSDEKYVDGVGALIWDSMYICEYHASDN